MAIPVLAAIPFVLKLAEAEAAAHRQGDASFGMSPKPQSLSRKT